MTSNEAQLVEMCNGELVTPDQAQAICQAVMAPVDALSAPFRKLVHEYGRNVTLALVESGVKDAAEAEFQLRSNRWQRQEQWLRTDYIPEGTRTLSHDPGRSRRTRTHPAGARNR